MPPRQPANRQTATRCREAGAAGTRSVLTFNFHGTTADQTKFQQTAYVLENTGVHAYLGQAGNIKTPAYLLAAASIVTIEARHSGAIGLTTAFQPTPSSPRQKAPPSKSTHFIV